MKVDCTIMILHEIRSGNFAFVETVRAQSRPLFTKRQIKDADNELGRLYKCLSSPIYARFQVATPIK